MMHRLQTLGLTGVETLRLMRTRTVMVSCMGRTLRVHEAFVDAPDDVLRAIVAFASARTRVTRARARDAILAYEIESGPVARRVERARPGDLALIEQLQRSHAAFNAQWFGGALQSVAIRLSGKMASRLGHYDPGTGSAPAEIALSRKHLARHGWTETLHTLLHEMVHQWQHETGQPIDHGSTFRGKCREVGITAAAKRTVTPVNIKRRVVRD